MAQVSEKYLTIPTEAGDVQVGRSSLSLIERIDSIVFDVDGVLIDVGESIQFVHKEAARRIFEAFGWTNCDHLVEPEDVDAFKLAGGFNNDWDVAAAWEMLYLLKSSQQGSTDGAVLCSSDPSLRDFAAECARRGGYLKSAIAALRETSSPGHWDAVQAQYDRAALERMFQEVYSGDMCPEVYGFEPQVVTGPGMIHKDRSLLDKNCLPALKLGIATGRTAGETRVAVRLMGWDDVFPPESLVTEDDGFLKPDPRILDLAVRRIGAKCAMYIGDTPDDMRTVKRYRDDFGPMLSCMVKTGLAGADGDGADMIASNVNAALLAVIRLIGGA